MKKQIKRTLAMVMAIAIVICAYSIGSIADSNVSLKEYSVIDIKNNIKTIGRTGTTTNGIYCDWTASGIEFSANCSGSVSVTVNTVATVDGTSGNDKDAYFTLYIDNIRQESRVKFVDGTNTVTIANNLESGNHTFKLVKQTEYYLAKCEFTKISLNGTLNSKPDKSKYVIEYIGDSITCGYSSINSGSDNWAPKNQDGTRTYAYLAAENFGAEARVVSRSSGKCTDTNENINLYNLYSYFDKYRNSSLKYDFSLQKPNALVFALGTNDGTQSVSYWETQFKAFSDLVRGGYNDYNIPIIVDMNFMKSNDNMRLNMVKALTNIKNANSTKYSKIYLTSSGSSCDNHPRTDSHLASANKLTRDLIEYGVFTTEDLKSDATTLVTSTSSDSNILNSFDTVVSPNDTTNISAEAVSSICNDSGKAVKYTANGSQKGLYPTYNITLGTIKNSSHATKGISFTIKYHNKSGTAKPSIVLYNSKTNHSTSYELSLSDNVTTTVNIDFDYLNSFMNLMHSEIGTGCNIGVYLNIGAANCEFTIDNAYLTLNSYKTATNSNSSYTYRSDYKYPIISETSQPSTTKKAISDLSVNCSMVYGASIRLGNLNGIRFYTKVDQDRIAYLRENGANVEIGTLIAPIDLISNELTFDTKKYLDVQYTAKEYYTENGFSGVVGSIVNIIETPTDYNSLSGNITREFVGRGYVKVTYDGKTVITYADYANDSIKNNTRSLQFVANALRNDNNSIDIYNKYKDLVDKWADAKTIEKTTVFEPSVADKW